jgi:hypothetical protein
VVALSIVTLERPRRSMFGLNVEVEPVTAVEVSVDEPVIDELCVVEEPVTDGLAVALPLAPTFVLAVPVVEADGLVLLVVAPLVALVPAALAVLVEGEVAEEACESGMQSMCTGLDERSLAIPVSLSANLPALGWFSSLHSGFAVAAFVPEVCAHAGAVPSIAARTKVLR